MIYALQSNVGNPNARIVYRYWPDRKRPRGRAPRSPPGDRKFRGVRAGRQRRYGSGSRHSGSGPIFRQAHREHSGTQRAHGPAARFADERHQLARLRFRRHHAQELHPPHVAGGVGAICLRQRESSVGTRLHGSVHPGLRGGVAHRQRSVSGALRRRLAHHRNRRSIRRGDRHWKTSEAPAARDDLGDRARGDTGGGAARDVRVHGQGVSSGPGGAKWLRCGAARSSRLHRGRAQPGGSAGLRRGPGRQVRPFENHGAVWAKISICARTPTNRFRAAL